MQSEKRAQLGQRGVGEMILMHIASAEKSAAVRSVAEQMGEEVKLIGYQELNRTLLGLHIGKPVTKEIKLPPLYQMPELLVFVGMPEERLDQFLDAYRAAGIEPVALKAVSTLHNSGWTVFELIEALKAERAGIMPFLKPIPGGWQVL